MLRYSAWCGVVALFLAASSCDSSRHSASGFRLPSDGDVERGKVAFVTLECHTCHKVAGVDLPSPTITPAVPVRLGGELPRQMTDGYLVSSIINPSYVLVGHPTNLVTVADGKSRMPVHADKLTVRQLTDIVAFLQSRYTVRPATRTPPPW